MPRINLVPHDRQEKGRRRSAVPSPSPSTGDAAFSGFSMSPGLIGGAVGILLLLVAVFFYFGERRALAGLEDSIAEARQDSVRLQQAVVQVRALEAAQVRLAGRVAIMSQVVDGRLFWIDLMETLSAVLPEYTWLEKIDQTDLAPDQIRIAGGTFANAAVTDYMRALEVSSELANVSLVGVSRVEREGVEYQAFTLIASFEGYRPVILTPAATPENQEN